jgi:glutaredoxin-related protein
VCVLSFSFVSPHLQEFSQWPTYPQVYVNGELLGGCDIVLEMHEAGELKEELAKAGGGGGKEALQQRLKQLLAQQPVMLFMKVRVVACEGRGVVDI